MHRSVSQLKLYERCPRAYKLSKIDRVWSKPAAWLAQGSAEHEAVEAWERSGRTLTVEETQDVFRVSYQKHIQEACETTPNFDLWFASGPYAGQLDIERRYQIGLDQIEKILAWYDTHQDAIWVSPDGTPGIELGFDIDLDGVLVRGFIDAVIDDGLGNLVVRDLKTGNHPGDDFQLGVYSVALAEQFGIEQPLFGDYFMGKTGKPTELFDLSVWTRERVVEKFKELDRNIHAGRFDPDPEPSKCKFCDVSWACDARV